MEKEKKERKSPRRGYPFKREQPPSTPIKNSKSNPGPNPGPQKKGKEENVKKKFPSKPTPPCYGVYSKKYVKFKNK